MLRILQNYIVSVKKTHFLSSKIIYLSSEEELYQAYRFREYRYTMATKRHLCTQ